MNKNRIWRKGLSAREIALALFLSATRERVLGFRKTGSPRVAALLFFFLSGVLPAAAGVSLKGTGSYLAAPLCQRWIADYGRLQKGARIKYEVKNSSDGIEQWLGRGADFALSDSPLTDEEERRTVGRAAYHLPVAVEAVAITYNLPGVPGGLRLTRKVLSGIFQGTVKRWDDPAIVDLNPGSRMPSLEIRVLHRQEESALHDLFPGQLAQLDAKWTLKREREKNLKWPVGQNVHGNEKVLEKLRKLAGTIAAVDYPYAARENLPLAQVSNSTGRFVAPSEASLSAAASDIVELSDDLKVALSRSRSPAAYPLCSFLWVLVYQDNARATHDPARGKALVEFLDWVLGDGQKAAEDVDYVPLREDLRVRVLSAVDAIRY